jgi:uncharacterized protein YecA (UPF0149 family)
MSSGTYYAKRERKEKDPNAVKITVPTAKNAKKLKPNDKCHCGSGKKLKKCCKKSAKECANDLNTALD